MSITLLDDVKASLRIIHTSDDAMLQKHIDASEREICQYLNREQLPTLPQDYPPLFDANGAALPEVTATAGNVAPEVFPAVCLLVQARADTASPDDIAKLCKCAETLIVPYRVRIGV